MIQKKPSNEHNGEPGGEADKDSILTSDRTADLVITSESSSSLEGSGSGDVEAEGVSMFILHYTILTLRLLPVAIK